MPRIPFIKLGHATTPEPPALASYHSSLALEGLQLGIDNLRYDVHLSPRFVEQIRHHIGKLVARNGGLQDLIGGDAPEPATHDHFIRTGRGPAKASRAEADLKQLLTQLQVAALNRAKGEGGIAVDLLARLAIIKFLRVELNSQFSHALERCRMLLKSFDGTRQERAVEQRERVAAFQVAKKVILRKAGQELLRTLREIEKETLARMRRSLFGNSETADYSLFLNPLLFTEDGCDDYLLADQYVMLGNFGRDLDRFANIRRITAEYLTQVGCRAAGGDDAVLDGWLNVPENAQELVGSGTVDDSTATGREQKARLGVWLEKLESERLMDMIVGSYEVVPLLSEYAPRINAQQLKNGLVSKEERERVEMLIAEHGKLSAANFYAAVGRVASCRGAERSRIASRFLRDFLRYHRDRRRLEALNGAIDSVNLIGNEKMRELSHVNGTLYEFLLPEEQKPLEEKVLHHVVLKADIRDSTRLTRSLLERSMNPASYFSLNFYDPVNKLLPKYGASKVFLEGDAIILTILERESEGEFTVGRACVLGMEILEIVSGYNEILTRAGLPSLELGIGISYQDSAPLYLMDGEQRIMISDALNESDRLSSCHKRVRKPVERLESPFRVYAFQTVSEIDAGENAEDFTMSYNLRGIRMNESAFQKLQSEISLQSRTLKLPKLWGSEEFHLFSGSVPVGNGTFRKLVVRASQIPQIDPASFSLVQWTRRKYYEVCTNPAVLSALEGSAAKAGK